jgi:hypothetical protein
MRTITCFTTLMLAAASLSAAEFHDVPCEGSYPHHLQGICTDGESIYWSFTTQLVKTDRNGQALKSIPVASHHGDLCFHEGRVYVAVNLGKFNQPAGQADSWIYIYNADDLSLASKHRVPEAVHGAGGVGVRDGRFFVVGGLPEGVDENYVYEYDRQLQFVRRHVLRSGYTLMGIQTATFAHGRWWFGCYGTPKTLLIANPQFRMLGRHEFDCSLGIEALPEGRLLSAGGRCEKEKGCVGWAKLAAPDDLQGLRILGD